MTCTVHRVTMHYISNQTRRVIYMTDQEWSALRQYAEANARSVSEVIRGWWRLAAAPPPGPTFGSPKAAPKPSQKGK